MPYFRKKDGVNILQDVQEVLNTEKEAEIIIEKAEQQCEVILSKAKRSALDYIATEKKKIDRETDNLIKERVAELKEEGKKIIETAEKKARRLFKLAETHAEEAEKLVIDRLLE